MKYNEQNHTFVICAYQESPYLKECIESIFKQNKLGKVILSTSTPNTYIKDLAEEYNIPLYINDGESGIAGDWNFAYSCVETDLLTIAHQDDIYEPQYLEVILNNINSAKHPLIVFSDYGELRSEKAVYNNSLLTIKRILLFPLRLKLNQSSVFVRRCALSIGSCICCPAVTYVKPNLPEPMFQSGFKSNIDWQAWEKISRMKGQFVYCVKPAMLHRIHEASTTTELINNEGRTKEDYEMFCMFWPKWIAKFIMKFYQKGQNSNRV